MRAPRAGLLVVSALAAGAPLFACQLVFPTVVDDFIGGGDAGDGGHRDADAARYNSITSKASWEEYALNAGGAVYSGGTFDGQYVYFAPRAGPAIRYDTHAEFNHAASWERFDTTQLKAATNHYFSGTAFDGRYVYYVPNLYIGVGPLGYDVVPVRFDTHLSFTDRRSWSSFDVTAALGKTVQPMSGATFDGRFLYFVPYVDGTVLAYDTRSGFGSNASWRAFDMTTVNGAAGGMVGAIYDGRYVYFIPNKNRFGTDGIVARYDTQAPFEDRTSWVTFDTKQLGANVVAFAGGAFDGRFIYLAPDVDLTGVVPRFDTHGDFRDVTSWSTFRTDPVSYQANGFNGAAFDGRFIYFVPFLSRHFDGLLVRYDTTSAFKNAGAWSSFRVSSLATTGVGFAGAVFDGQYLYLVPDRYPSVFRFDAREPPAMPALPEFHGSFF